MSPPDLLDLARGVADMGADGEQVECYATRSLSTDVKVFDGEVESLSVAEVDGVGVRVVASGRQGYAWAGSLDATLVRETLDETRDNAAFGAPDESYGLAMPGDFAGVEQPVLDLWRDSLRAVPTDEKVELALEVERATRAADPRVRGVEVAGYGDNAVEVAIASSHGVEATGRRTLCSCFAFAMAGEAEATQTGYGVTAGRSVDELDVAGAAGDAAARAVRMLGARQPRSRRLPVVLDPHVSRSLLAIVGAALGGEAVLKGRSMFVGREGEAVAAPVVTIIDDPTLPEAFGAAAHDAEGVPTRPTTLIETGRLTRFLHNVYTARRTGLVTTGSAVRGGFKSTPGVGARGLHLAPGRRAPEEVLGGLREGLYVQSVTGLHSGTNPVSGDFSLGAEGLMVRDGELAEPVRELTVASTLPRILLDIAEVGSDLTWLPGGAAGVTLLVSEMTMSGA